MGNWIEGLGWFFLSAWCVCDIMGWRKGVGGKGQPSVREGGKGQPSVRGGGGEG